jgi:hypothetical protein
MIKLYIQDENYHFDGYLSGILINEDNNKIALFRKEGISENNIILEIDKIKWLELDSFGIINNNIKIRGKNLSIYKEFYCLGIKEFDENGKSI